MARFISLFLLFALLVANISVLSSCKGVEKPDNNPSSNTENKNPSNDNTSDTGIVVPAYKDYNRGTINYENIEYKRPDIDDVTSSAESVSDIITKNEISFELQMEKIEEIEAPYNNVVTMATIVDIETRKNSADEFWAGEYEYINTSYPSFAQSIEKIFVAAANSVHAEQFESEYFGEGLIEDYKDGGIYTDELVFLMEEEAKAEAEYSAISTATVIITYDGMTDTVDNILKSYSEKYGSNSSKYLSASAMCKLLYEDERKILESEILVELFKIRSRIGKSYGDGYLEFAYESIYHDYSPDDELKFIKNVTEYVLPVYLNLSVNNVFYEYKKTGKPEALNRVNLINNVSAVLKQTDAELYDIYSYMLQHKLYDIDKENTNRYEGAFTTYIEDYSAPYLFLTTSGNTTDYSTLFHEFGHFADYYINYNSDTSLDLSEVSSQALSLLMLTKLDTKMSAAALDYITRYELESALKVLIFQSFYALFEHYAYSISEEDISKETLDAAVVRAAEEMNLNTSAINSIEAVSIPHIFLYPTYVQSYCTSIVVSLEIYYLEVENTGAGFAAYKTLLDRDTPFLTFEEELQRAEISSPFDSDVLKNIADKIHYSMYGKHFFELSGNVPAA